MKIDLNEFMAETIKPGDTLYYAGVSYRVIDLHEDATGKLIGLLTDQGYLIVSEDSDEPVAKVPCTTNHFDIAGGNVCRRCGKLVRRDDLGREIDPPEGTEERE